MVSEASVAGHPDVAGRRAAEVGAEERRHGGDRQQAEDVDGQDEEEDAPDVLDEAVRVLAAGSGCATSLRRYSQIASRTLAGAGRHQAADAVPAPAGACTSAGTKRISSSPARIIIDDLVGEQGDPPLGREEPEVRRLLDQRMLDHVLERIGGHHHRKRASSNLQIVFVSSEAPQGVPGVHHQQGHVADRDPQQQGPRANQPERAPRRPGPARPRTAGAIASHHRRHPCRRRRTAGRAPPGCRPPREAIRQMAHPPARRDRAPPPPAAGPVSSPARRPTQRRPPPRPGTAGTPAARSGPGHRFSSPSLRRPASLDAISDWRIRLYIPPTRPSVPPISNPQGSVPKWRSHQYPKRVSPHRRGQLEADAGQPGKTTARRLPFLGHWIRRTAPSLPLSFRARGAYQLVRPFTSYPRGSERRGSTADDRQEGEGGGQVERHGDVQGRDLPLAADQLLQSGPGEDPLDRLLDLQEDLADSAVVAAHVDGAREGQDVVDGRGLPFQRQQDVAERDLGCRPAQDVPALRPAVGLDQPCPSRARRGSGAGRAPGCPGGGRSRGWSPDRLRRAWRCRASPGCRTPLWSRFSWKPCSGSV